MHTSTRTTTELISRYEKKENEEEEEEIEATDTSRCWRRQILKSGETNNRGVSPEIRSGVGAGGRRSSRSSVGNGKRHVSKSESSCSSANLTREKIRLLYVDYSEQETGKRRGEESFERVRSWSGNHGVLMPVAELDTVSLDRFELATSKD